MKIMLLKEARPFKVKIYLICFNNKCFDFKLIIYILILIVPNLDQLDLGTSPSIKCRSPPTELHRLARLAGRVIEKRS